MLAAALFAAAALTDFLDGYLARASQATTRLGQYLDPIADKVLLSAVFIALAVVGAVPVWYVVLVFGRDFAILAASAVAMRFTSYDNYRPTIWGKISTFWQIAAAVVALFPAAHTPAAVVIGISAVATAWSGAHYAWRGIAHFVK